MILRKPDFYDTFKCIASQCTDTCCVGWEIDVDRNSQEVYNKVAGTFGEKLRANIEDGHFKLLPHDRCPFLTGGNLCEIYTNLGEGALCDICREHPRFVEVYGNVMERGLGLCCEEATRLLLAGNGPLAFVSEESDEPEDELSEDDREICNEVLYEREYIFRTLADFDKPFGNRLYDAFGYTGDKPFAPLNDARGLYELLAKTESFGPAWDEALTRIKESIENAAGLQDEGYFSETESARLLAYLVYRHYAKCLFEGREEGKRNFALFFWNAVRFFTRELAGIPAFETNKASEINGIAELNSAAPEGQTAQRVKINAIKILSRQLEYSEENMELIEKELDG
ncbi:lysine-N-methylase [Fibrobacter sp. UWR3]|uniref:flagellin lysine-N-methylase n=1 Tax=Fibrobacter sp. UWR3 TaxID=1896217 RepID=UPI0009163069|nr:flagellin lysine-N-methylase [Fibrobacter sp. UWR3]SHM33711.1 lysine-N-methylase [Fibrobacter sp. UWR3]